MCRYSEWTRPVIVDMTDLALCAEKDALNFTSRVCADAAVVQNLLANQDNGWLLQHCANRTDGGSGGEGGGGGFDPAERCRYSSWASALPDVALLTLCWEHDQAAFVSFVCASAGLRLRLTREPSSSWVGSMCSTFANFTAAANNASCLARSLARRFNWSCSAVLASACEAGAGGGAALRAVARCWAESLGSRVGEMLAAPSAAVLDQAVSSGVVVLLALEEVGNVTLHVTENVRAKVLEGVTEFLKSKDDFENKRVLLQCFGVGGGNITKPPEGVS